MHRSFFFPAYNYNAFFPRFKDLLSFPFFFFFFFVHALRLLSSSFVVGSSRLATMYPLLSRRSPRNRRQTDGPTTHHLPRSHSHLDHSPRRNTRSAVVISHFLRSLRFPIHARAETHTHTYTRARTRFSPLFSPDCVSPFQALCCK